MLLPCQATLFTFLVRHTTSNLTVRGNFAVRIAQARPSSVTTPRHPPWGVAQAASASPGFTAGSSSTETARSRLAGPRSMGAPMSVKGIEEKIAERYGQALLAVVASAS